MGSDVVASLSSELLAKILFQVEGGAGDGLSMRFVEPKGLFESQGEFNLLRTVCRKFYDVFTSEPILSRGLVLSPDFSSRKLPLLAESFLACYLGHESMAPQSRIWQLTVALHAWMQHLVHYKVPCLH